MALPQFNIDGDLPIGVHLATISEVKALLGSTSHRRIIVMTRLERVYNLAIQTNCVAHFIVFGSFVTNKAAPNDVDVFMVMENKFDADSLKGEVRLLFDHNAADAFFGASVFWLRRIAAFGGIQETIGHWQNRRDGGKRGIIEVIGIKQNDNE